VIVALAGGVGGARFAVGLAQVLKPKDLTIIVNTGDDFEHLGLAISPDLDTVMYTLAGVSNPATGWGRAGETWSFMAELKRLGGEDWFSIGDKDLAVHAVRTAALRRGKSLSEVTRLLYRRFEIRHAVVPMSDTPVRTRVRTGRGELDFQDYFVRLKCEPKVKGFRFDGARRARLPDSLGRILRGREIRALLIAPSNPFVSVAPILSVPALRRWLDKRNFPVIAVSPIVGGAALKGPAAKMMRELGLPVSALGVARHYGALVDGWVIDRVDGKLRPAIEREGRRVLIADTIMKNRARSARLAGEVIAFARTLTEPSG
jgi:LPPG:FO 2-phospho-L-lactate transferase